MHPIETRLFDDFTSVLQILMSLLGYTLELILEHALLTHYELKQNILIFCVHYLSINT